MSKAEVNLTTPIIEAAGQVAKAVGARALFAYYDALDDPDLLLKAVKAPTDLILVCRREEDVEKVRKIKVTPMSVPSFSLTRMDQIKMATLIAFSQGLLKGGETFVFLTGVVGQGIDTIVTMRVGEEYELFQSVGQPKLTEHIRRPVFEKVLTLCLELAHEGREGKSVGAIFVIGDHREVQKCCREGRINPFKGYAENERNILDDSIRDIVKEMSKLDGAFILKGNGVILSGGATLLSPIAGEPHTQGLGSRHAAAAAITAGTKSIAISLSQSTGTVRIWRLGTVITEIQKMARSGEGPTEATS